MKPGMTGWAQVNGCRGPMRRAIQLRRRVDHDLYYVEHCSLLLDLRILLQTVSGFVGSKPMRAERFSATGRGRARSRRQYFAAEIEEFDLGRARRVRDRASKMQPPPLDDGVQLG